MIDEKALKEIEERTVACLKVFDVRECFAVIRYTLPALITEVRRLQDLLLVRALTVGLRADELGERVEKIEKQLEINHDHPTREEAKAALKRVKGLCDEWQQEITDCNTKECPCCLQKESDAGELDAAIKGR